MRIYMSMTLLLLVFACNNGDTKKQNNIEVTDTSVEVKQDVQAEFDGDSAYAFVKQQVDFGPRFPGSAGWKNCYNYLVKFMKSKADTVYLPISTARTYDGKTIPVQNIIGVFNPKATRRILLCAHWDTRPYADQDDVDKDKPILGANDGASGVGILMEMASQIKKDRPEIGVDIIFFDAEDWGDNTGMVENSFCLGSQDWGKNLHVKGYKADFGVLLDMVGAPNALFGFEGYSLNMAQNYLAKVWGAANNLGYGNYFKAFQRGAVTDDHFYVMKATNIPMIDVIDTDPSTESHFGRYWHTHDDNMDAIDKRTLKAVGHTLMYVLRNY